MKNVLFLGVLAGILFAGCGKQPAAPENAPAPTPSAAVQATPPSAAEAPKPAELKPAETNEIKRPEPAPELKTAETNTAAAAPASATNNAVLQPSTAPSTLTNAASVAASRIGAAANAASNALQGAGQSIRDTATQTGLGALSNQFARLRGESNTPVSALLAAAATNMTATATNLAATATNLAASTLLGGAAATPQAPAGITGSLAALPKSLSADAVTEGLKQALGKGLERAVAELGKSGGFLTNLNVKIPMPPAMQSVEKALRTIGQDQMANDFVATLNTAAEQAVPASATVFTNALAKLTLKDVQSILQGGPDAATQFFRKNTEVELREKFMPIVREATSKVGVTTAYKQLMAKAQFAAPLLGRDTVDLDSYVANKSLDGLFKMVAEEEKRIRENPAARSTELLKSVFGGLLSK